MLRGLARPKLRDALVALLTRIRMGTGGFAVKAEAEGADGRTHACSVNGHGVGHATGIVATLAAESLYTSPRAASISHIEQLFNPAEFFRRAADHRLTVDPGTPHLPAT
ncbi:hypothetical protein GBA63_19850 [Rubrobacter tropicus]|uniref:Uncharacterized protein n=1 Tax=Rubrobacter tropicus TaxID=2653851 RepID=A0A6G8QDX2_9ACTN|nr:hypothetical protein [Rubrobacter tropicus]QIN84653.1 hypothetical protein GBA63_19850 [Rubrobacter tropicus]